MAKQMLSFIQPNLSNLLCGFREGFSTQHALFRVAEMFRRTIDQSGIVGVVLMDLLKPYDCLSHDLLIAKMAAYGFSNKSLELLYSYLSNREQRFKMNSTFSDWKCKVYGVPQGSVLGPLLFNTFINDFVLAIQSSQVCNFADDNTVFACGTNVEEVIACLEFDIENAISWFRENNMVANPDKFQMMFIGLKESKRYCLDINGNIIVNTDTVKLLGVTIDSKLNFREHVTHICKR